jgi:hypothetical protein
MMISVVCQYTNITMTSSSFPNTKFMKPQHSSCEHETYNHVIIAYNLECHHT